ncbi:MAG: IS110 family transposase [Opitutaceae bacterium]|jgi:transposase|nr:IS110 family transposase [Opitutaceae bacterium]
MNDKQENKPGAARPRVIGQDMHPDVFTAAALCPTGHDASQARVHWVHDRQKTEELEQWAGRHLRKTDVVVLEASGNSFEVAHRLHQCGHTALVLESEQASAIKDKFCNDDRFSAVKLARAWLTGLAKQVWQPDATVREHREVFIAHRNAVKDATRTRNRIRSYLNEHCIRLKAGTALTDEKTLKMLLAKKAWSDLQGQLLEGLFTQLWQAEQRRERLERIMVQELAARPVWAQLWRLMGIRHRVAFGLMAILGDIHRFATAKKLVGYLGLCPRRDQSGINAKGHEKGLGHCGRADLRSLLLQSAQNALTQRSSPLHKWGWKLTVRKHRNLAAAAVARKLTVSIWYLLMAYYTELNEPTQHLTDKLLKLATLLGKDLLRKSGFASRDAFVQQQLVNLQNLPKNLPLPS